MLKDAGIPIAPSTYYAAKTRPPSARAERDILVSAEIGCSLTLSSVIDSIADPHLRFLRLTDDVAPVELRMAWLRDSDDRALHAVLRLSESVLPTPQG